MKRGWKYDKQIKKWFGVAEELLKLAGEKGDAMMEPLTKQSEMKWVCFDYVLWAMVHAEEPKAEHLLSKLED